jgi:hypothetical protein
LNIDFSDLAILMKERYDNFFEGHDIVSPGYGEPLCHTKINIRKNGICLTDMFLLPRVIDGMPARMKILLCIINHQPVSELKPISR